MKQLVIQHIEKAVLVLVAILGIWSVYSTFTNEETLTEAEDEKLLAIDQRLNSAAAKPGTPNFAPVRDSKNAMTDRLAIQVEAVAQAGFLWDHPDIGSIIVPPNLGEPYILEVGMPGLEAKSRVGQIDLVMTVPTATRENKARQFVKDALAGVEWSQDYMKDNQVETRQNSASVVGALVEMRIGKGAWQPFVGEGVTDGFLPLTPGQGFAKLSYVNAIEGQTYAFRSRLVAKASAPGAGEKFSFRREVLVVSPALKDVADDVSKEDAKAIHAMGADATLAEEFRQRYASAKAELVTAKPAGVALRDTEKLFLGALVPEPENEVLGDAWVVDVEPLSSTLVALERVTTFGGETTATILVMRQFDLQGNGQRVWLGPVKYKVKIGEAIGKNQQVVNTPDGGPVQVDFSTPFTLKSTKKADRIWYYELERKGGFAANGVQLPKQLRVKPKIKKGTDLVILDHGIKNKSYQLVRLERNVRIFPRKSEKSAQYYPDIAEPGIKEIELFGTDPVLFEQPILTPRPPVQHDDAKLLLRLATQKVILAAEVNNFEMPYFELADGRVMAYDKLRDAPRVLVIPGSEADRAGDKPKPAAEGVPLEELEEVSADEE